MRELIPNIFGTGPEEGPPAAAFQGGRYPPERPRKLSPDAPEARLTGKSARLARLRAPHRPLRSVLGASEADHQGQLRAARFDDFPAATTNFRDFSGRPREFPEGRRCDTMRHFCSIMRQAVRFA